MVNAPLHSKGDLNTDHVAARDVMEALVALVIQRLFKGRADKRNGRKVLRVLKTFSLGSSSTIGAQKKQKGHTKDVQVKVLVMQEIPQTKHTAIRRSP